MTDSIEIAGSFGVLRAPGTILFGTGQRRGLAGLVSPLGSRVLLCTDARMAADPECQALVAQLERAGLTVTVFGDTTPELPVSDIVDCVAGLDGTRHTTS